MTLLEIVQQHARRTGITVPSIAISSPEAQIQMCIGLLNEDLEDLVQRKGWQILTREAVWTSFPGEDQGFLRDLAPGIINDGISKDTFWDRTGSLKFVGPLSPSQDAANKAQGLAVNTHVWRVYRGRLWLDTAFPGGHVLAFEYYTDRAVQSIDGLGKAYFTADDDEPLLPATLHLAGLRWRWKREQGLAYDEDFRRYEELVANAMGQDGGRTTINADCVDSPQPNAGITVSVGSWPL